MSKEKPLLKLKNVSKFYYNKGVVASGFTKVNLSFDLGEFVVITGESGSGKSTLLNVLSGLDTYEEGEMYIGGKETSHYGEADFEHYRKTYIGNIFQSFNLVNSYTVYQNIELVLLLNGYNKKDIKQKILDLIKEVDLYRFRNTKVSRLSGGQKQRVAIARALAKDTPIIIADEPTGNLDSKSAKSVIKLLSEIAKDKLVVIVTHNYDQVEEYATRKIEMHDGKVREDIDLKDYQKSETEVFEYKDINFFSKIRLGLRNTFNIYIKFILMFVVFLFITLSFLGTYSSFKNSEHEEMSNGYNQFFTNTDETRIIVTKKDKSSFTSSDYDKISKLEYFGYLEKNDTLLDNRYSLENDMYNFYGNIKSIKALDKVDDGRLPEKDNEVVVRGYKYDYYISNTDGDLYNQELMMSSNYGNKIELDEKLKVVGVIKDDNYDYNSIYVSDSVLEKIRFYSNIDYTKTNININGNDFESSAYKYENVTLAPNKNVKAGHAIFDFSQNYLCKNYYCTNQEVKINIENLYFKDELNVKITDVYTKYNMKNLLGLDNYDNNLGKLFISYEDYNKLYNKENYQSSVFAKDSFTVDRLNTELENLGYKTLMLKDTIIVEGAGVLEVLQIFKTIVVVFLFIVLFFISYFVIRLIQKSKNVYYSTVRILGGSKKVINDFIKIELFTVCNIAYFFTILLIILVKKEIISFTYIKNLSMYLYLKDYIIIYVLMILMSLLISSRYSRKLFKSSAMKTYNEEA